MTRIQECVHECIWAKIGILLSGFGRFSGSLGYSDGANLGPDHLGT